MPLELVTPAEERIVLQEKAVGDGHERIVYDGAMDVKAARRRRLEDTTEWARKLRQHLHPLQQQHGQRVHFRPGSSGISMVGLLHHRAQRGKSGITNLEGLVKDFETDFTAHCDTVDHKRLTPEKQLQSFLIRNAYANDRRLRAINEASLTTNDPVELVFVTDEISMPSDASRFVVTVPA